MDIIVYTLVSRGGGIDGMDASDKPGRVTAAYATRLEAERDRNLPWSTIEPVVVDPDKVIEDAKKKLTPIEQLFCLPIKSTIKRGAQCRP